MATARRRSAKAICLSAMLAVVVSTVGLGSVAAAARIPGTTLSYKQTSKGEVSRTMVALTRKGKIALLGLDRPRSYLQFDGNALWACTQGEECRVASRGAKAKKSAEFFEDEFFDPYGKHGFANAFMKDPKPAGRRTVAGVASTCKTSPDVLGHGQPYLLCTANRGGFLTLLEAGNETYALQHAASGVKSSFLAIPQGKWDGQL
jgi:hypothetical protein